MFYAQILIENNHNYGGHFDVEGAKKYSLNEEQSENILTRSGPRKYFHCGPGGSWGTHPRKSLF